MGLTSHRRYLVNIRPNSSCLCSSKKTEFMSCFLQCEGSLNDKQQACLAAALSGHLRVVTHGHPMGMMVKEKAY